MLRRMTALQFLFCMRNEGEKVRRSHEGAESKVQTAQETAGSLVDGSLWGPDEDICSWDIEGV